MGDRIEGSAQNIAKIDENQFRPVFWRRIIAFIVDAVLLFLLGFLLGFFFEAYFSSLGPYGRLVGFFISLIYFATMNSKLFRGQTIGKKLAQIKLVDKNNNFISVPKSILRYLIIGVPIFLNGAVLDDKIIFSAWTYLLSLIVFGIPISIIYLFLFNRKTRQSLHDLIVGTYVVDEEERELTPSKIWRTHYYIAGIISIASLFVPFYIKTKISPEAINSILSINRVILQNEKIKNINILVGFSKSIGKEGTKELNYVSATVVLKDRDINDKNLALFVAQKIFLLYPQIKEKDIISVRLTYGYDIGISSKWVFQTYNFNIKK